MPSAFEFGETVLSPAETNEITRKFSRDEASGAHTLRAGSDTPPRLPKTNPTRSRYLTVLAMAGGPPSPDGATAQTIAIRFPSGALGFTP